MLRLGLIDFAGLLSQFANPEGLLMIGGLLLLIGAVSIYWVRSGQADDGAIGWERGSDSGRHEGDETGPCAGSTGGGATETLKEAVVGSDSVCFSENS